MFYAETLGDLPKDISKYIAEYEPQLIEILEAGYTFVSDILPSEWTEQNMVMQKPFPGPFKYSKTPYAREIIDRLSPNDPCHTLALMKGAQIGMSSGVIIPGIGWIIANNPGNTYLSVGAPDLVAPAMEKLDLMIDATGLRSLIKPQSQRVKNNKTGDTNEKKEFPNGYVALGSANNHKNLRQVDLQFVFLDDVEAIKKSSEQSGDTLSMVEQRQASYYGKSKLFLVSTPELKEKSNIEPAYLKGDQRKYMIPCPCCGSFIDLRWSYENDNKEMVGIYWELDEKNELIPESVGYKCQECTGFFNDKNKDELLNAGFWKPTAKPITEGYYSYHISSLYAPIGMFDWLHYVKKYLEACPPGGVRDETKYKTFVNVCLGLTYELETEKINSNKIQRNTRDYQVSIVPEKVSMDDGNGKVVLLTCAMDLNGRLDDARIDYEVLAWSESMSTYSVKHGSIGTFIPNQTREIKEKDTREKWTYEHGKPNSVWPVVKELLSTVWEVDTGRKMQIFFTGIDTGYQEALAFEFIDNCNFNVCGLKGDKEDEYIPFSQDKKTFKPGQSRPNLYLVLGGKIKDELARQMKLNWNPARDEKQPSGFCNYPEPSGGMYTYSNFFSHYESEQRKIESKDGKEVSAKWTKISPTAQNHLWDCRVYNMAAKDILMKKTFEILKIQNGTWADFAAILNGTYKK